ncbi:MAG: DUF1361 domain-containing protein [Chitinophagaceae bacterium]|nr:DUF1361 domain-containing protein [Chitinophagaceae bacterium]
MNTLLPIKNRSVYHYSLEAWLLASCLFSVALLFARIVATGQATYVFLVWNLFLAFIPFAISRTIIGTPPVNYKRWKIVATLGVWLLFIPNSFYIITDLFHLEYFSGPPKWFDLLLLLSFAWNGLVLGILSLSQVESFIEKARGKGFSLTIVVFVMWLNAFGIYVGRYLRYNSWDVIVQPVSLFQEMMEILLHPLQNRMEWGMITCYAVFMSLLYVTIRSLSLGFTPGQTINQKTNQS